MFTIRKIRNIQHYFLNEPQGSSGKLQNPKSHSIYESLVGNPISEEVKNYLLSVSQKTKDILGHDIINELIENDIDILRPFFIKFPNAWYDLKRKLHKHGEYRMIKGVKGWYISGDNEELIISTFLRLNRDDDTGEAIRKNIHEEIFSNQKLTKQTQKEPSMLDTSHNDIAGISISHQVGFLQKMIIAGLEANNTSEGSINTEGLFKELLGPILNYLKSIFGIQFNETIKNCKNIHELAKNLQPFIWNKTSKESGRDGKNAWMLVKAFRAWGSLGDIRKKNSQSRYLVTNIPSKLSEIDAHVSNVETVTERYTKNGIEEECNIFKGDIKMKLSNGSFFSCKIEYRAKTVRSILIKMWESEDYNTVDALRDMLGIAIIWPDNTPEDIKLEMIQKFTGIMPNYGYMFKNKGLLGADSQKKLKQYFKQDNSKKPLGMSIKMKGKSDPKLNNVSLSGFTSINDIYGSPNDKVSMGCEIQFHNQSGYEWWKKDHYRFDPKKIISAICRGSYFITPHQIFNIIKEEIPDDILKQVLQSTIKKEYIRYVRSGLLIPYTINNNELLFTTKDYKSGFLEKFRHAHKVHINDDSSVFDFIKEINLSESSKS